ncbi:MAG: histidine kinase [Tolypothrix carrinoi HA7290-LM1]|nr:histidine kinase [Tolypothrix carrinoi HA7290-LM1]
MENRGQGRQGGQGDKETRESRGTIFCITYSQCPLPNAPCPLPPAPCPLPIDS